MHHVSDFHLQLSHSGLQWQHQLSSKFWAVNGSNGEWVGLLTCALWHLRYLTHCPPVAILLCLNIGWRNNKPESRAALPGFSVQSILLLMLEKSLPFRLLVSFMALSA